MGMTKSELKEILDEIRYVSDMGSNDAIRRNVKTTKVEFIESYIKHGPGDYEWSDNHGELIRCRDCRFWEDGNAPDWWPCAQVGTEPDFYCGYAKRRTESEATP